MADDFTEKPPSRSLRRPEEAGLTDEQRRDADAIRIYGRDEPKVKPLQWEPGRPSDPRVLRLLNHPHAPNGQPLPPGRFQEPPPAPPKANDAELAAHQGRRFRLYSQWLEDDDSYMNRFRFWVGLDAGSKSQLAADAMFGKEDAPSWLCSCTDGSQPPLVLKAADEHVAKQRYKQLTGILSIQPSASDGYADPFSAQRYEPAPAA
jgi:hypothetical protein